MPGFINKQRKNYYNLDKLVNKQISINVFQIKEKCPPLILK